MKAIEQQSLSARYKLAPDLVLLGWEEENAENKYNNIWLQTCIEPLSLKSLWVHLDALQTVR